MLFSFIIKVEESFWIVVIVTLALTQLFNNIYIFFHLRSSEDEKISGIASIIIVYIRQICH